MVWKWAPSVNFNVLIKFLCKQFFATIDTDSCASNSMNHFIKVYQKVLQWRFSTTNLLHHHQLVWGDCGHPRQKIELLISGEKICLKRGVTLKPMKSKHKICWIFGQETFFLRQLCGAGDGMAQTIQCWGSQQRGQQNNWTNYQNIYHRHMFVFLPSPQKKSGNNIHFQNEQKVKRRQNSLETWFAATCIQSLIGDETFI